MIPIYGQGRIKYKNRSRLLGSVHRQPTFIRQPADRIVYLYVALLCNNYSYISILITDTHKTFNDAPSNVRTAFQVINKVLSNFITNLRSGTWPHCCCTGMPQGLSDGQRGVRDGKLLSRQQRAVLRSYHHTVLFNVHVTRRRPGSRRPHDRHLGIGHESSNWN